jgi:hypothetical protein
LFGITRQEEFAILVYETPKAAGKTRSGWRMVRLAALTELAVIMERHFVSREDFESYDSRFRIVIAHARDDS